MSLSITGNAWQRLFRFCDYDSTGKVILESSGCKVEDVKRLFLDEDADRTSLQIKSLRAYGTDLGKVRHHSWIQRHFCCICNIFRGSLKHHFLEMELASGKIVSAEKTVAYLLFQSCSSSDPAAPDGPPAVRRFREGQLRRTSEEGAATAAAGEDTDALVTIVTDKEPLSFDLLDVIEWIHDQNLLEETYHVSDANCQHFVGLLWSQLSSRPYPYPRQFNQPIEPMRSHVTQARGEPIHHVESGKMAL